MQQQQQQQQQQRGGSQQYGPPPPPPPPPQQHPELTPFPSRMLGITDPPPPPPQVQLAEAASPISSRPPPPQPPASFEELIPSSAADEDALDGDRGGGGASGGNRWPRQETLALLKIRSDMDAAFRDATLKAPLWDEVSRKLGELGYKRSAKKCKEKFENVQKYYKRTKEGRAGRQDGKTYRFFTQLEALHAASGAAAPSAIAFSAPMSGPSPAPRIHPLPISSAAPPPIPEQPIHGIPAASAAPPAASAATATAAAAAAAAAAVAGFSFSSNTSSSDSEESDDETEEEEEEEEEEQPGRKRKRRSGSGSGSGGGRSSKKMMAFFEGLMRQVMERQEEMQKRFLETLEKREQDRAMREDAWRRQETARLAREQELLAQERAMAASRAAAVVSFIQKISGQAVQLPVLPDASITVVTPSPAPPPPQPPPQKPPSSTPPQPPPKEKSGENAERKESASTDIVVFGGQGGGAQDPAGNVPFEAAGPPSSRWPKAEVHALIKLRTGLDTQYQEMGPKGPLWEEISARMRRLGYNRSAKRCKEKWENINKYFKKVKESNKKRPEDAKTCPYFHQLDALYRKKLDRAGGSGGGIEASVPRQLQPPQLESNTNAPSSQEGADALTLMAAASSSSHPPPSETDTKNGGGGGGGNNGNRSGGGVQTSNGGLAPIFAANKPGDAVTGQGEKIDEGGSDNMDHDYDEDDDDEDDDDEERGKMQFEIQFQRQGGSGGGGGGGGGGNSSNNTSAPTTTTTSSFLAMVHQ